MRVPTPDVARPRPTVVAETVSKPDVVVDRSRLSAFAKLIENITGRQVKMVPPFTYLVSGPPAPEPEPESESERPTELIVPRDLPRGGESESDPLVVDISSVLRRGTADRMVLNPIENGAFALIPPLDLAL